MNLQDLKDKGVQQLTVKNGEATAVNPWEQYYTISHDADHPQAIRPVWAMINSLPPLVTSGITDGVVKIEDVEEQWQVLEDGEWFSVAKGKALSLYTDLENRFILRKKQPEEVKPKGEAKGSFCTEQFIMVNCRKCEEPYSTDGDSAVCFNDKETAVETVISYGWEVDGEIAICEECLKATVTNSQETKPCGMDYYAISRNGCPHAETAGSHGDVFCKNAECKHYI